jgi:hypothetical protein
MDGGTCVRGPLAPVLAFEGPRRACLLGDRWLPTVSIYADIVIVTRTEGIRILEYVFQRSSFMLWEGLNKSQGLEEIS